MAIFLMCYTMSSSTRAGHLAGTAKGGKVKEQKKCISGVIGKKCDGERLHSTKYRGGKKLYCTPCLSIVLARLRAMAESPVRLNI
jgi:hypothetical protein